MAVVLRASSGLAEARGAGAYATGSLPLVVVAAGAVDVAVGEFFLGGFADVFDGDVEGERDAGEGVVGVDGDGVAIDLGDGDDGHGALWGLGAELHAGLDVGYALEGGARDGLDEGFVAFAVGVFGGDGDFELVAGGFSFEGFFEAGDEVAGAVEVGEWLLADGGIDDVSIGAGEGVIDGDDGILGDLHSVLQRQKWHGGPCRNRSASW